MALQHCNTAFPKLALLALFFNHQDSLLIAIREDYVDGVECLLRYEEETHQPGKVGLWWWSSGLEGILVKKR